jgi:hypothetical protein
MSEELEIGPVDVVVIGWPAGTPQTGEAVPHLIDLVDRGIIRILDLLLVKKTDEGDVVVIELTDIDGDGENDLLVFVGAQTGLLGEEDAAAAGEGIENGAAALLIAFENTWAAPFASAVRRNGGELVAFERVAAEDLLAAAEALA